MHVCAHVCVLACVLVCVCGCVLARACLLACKIMCVCWPVCCRVLACLLVYACVWSAVCVCVLVCMHVSMCMFVGPHACVCKQYEDHRHALCHPPPALSRCHSVPWHGEGHPNSPPIANASWRPAHSLPLRWQEGAQRTAVSQEIRMQPICSDFTSLPAEGALTRGAEPREGQEPHERPGAPHCFRFGPFMSVCLSLFFFIPSFRQAAFLPSLWCILAGASSTAASREAGGLRSGDPAVFTRQLSCSRGGRGPAGWGGGLSWRGPETHLVLVICGEKWLQPPHKYCHLSPVSSFRILGF